MIQILQIILEGFFFFKKKNVFLLVYLLFFIFNELKMAREVKAAWRSEASPLRFVSSFGETMALFWDCFIFIFLNFYRVNLTSRTL